jgi:hypothetical protein
MIFKTLQGARICVTKGKTARNVLTLDAKSSSAGLAVSANSSLPH